MTVLFDGAKDIDISGLDVPEDILKTLLSVDAAQWQKEMQSVGDYLEEFGERLPEKLRQEHQRIMQAVEQAAS